MEIFWKERERETEIERQKKVERDIENKKVKEKMSVFVIKVLCINNNFNWYIGKWGQ